MTDEIEELVAQVQGDEVEESETEEPPSDPEVPPEREIVDNGEPEPPKPKRKRARKPKEDNGAKTIDEMDAGFSFLGEQALPKPAENVKSLGDMYNKYGVGMDPDFKVQVYRTYPKMFRGKKFDGFYDTWDIPVSLEEIQAEYGGGQYRIRVVGPHPTNPNMTTRHYDSMGVSIAGDPRWERVPRAMEGKEVTPTPGSPSYQMPPPAVAENPKLAEAAMKMAQATAEAERDERRRVEDRAESRRLETAGGMAPVIEAERRRSDDVIAAERARGASERQIMDERLHEERTARESMRTRMDTMGSNQRSIGEEIASLAAAGLFKSGDDGGTTRAMLTQILEKHRGEMTAVQTSHMTFIESLRQGHASEIVAIREAHRSETTAVNEAGRSREGRIDERLQSEREERRRDQDRHRETTEQRDLQWKDRMDQAQQTLQSSWESRHQALVSTYENRIQWLQQEVDRVKSELSEQRGKQEEKGDILTQLGRLGDVQQAIKTIGGADPSASASASSSGGIGLSGGDDWKATLVEGLGDRLPALIGALTGAGAQPVPPAAPPQYQEGQVVTHDGGGQPFPQGPMIVVRDPGSGQLALAPKEAFEAHQKAVAKQKVRGGGTALPDGSRREERQQPIAAVPNLAEGLPKRRPPWEGGGSGERSERSSERRPPPPPPPEAPQRMTTRAREEAQHGEPIELSNMERQAVKLIAKEIHQSVMEADDPEEFVAKMMSNYESAVLKQIVSGYTTLQIAQGIAQVEPGSAGATPGGQQFIQEAFALLREALQ